MTLSPGCRIVTVLFLLETSMPTAFMILDPFVLDCNGRCGFSHCPFNLLGFYTNTRFHLRKTNAANEEPVGRLCYGLGVLGDGGQTGCILILTA